MGIYPLRICYPQIPLLSWFKTEHFLRVANISSGTKMPRAEWANIEKEPFDIPCILIQEKIVSILEAIDKKICTSGDSLRMLINFREGLLQQLFI